MREELIIWAKSLCEYAGENESFKGEFLQKLIADKEVLEEFAYYYDNHGFLGSVNVNGMTLVDILVWQVDHFKSDLDRGLYDMQSNPDKMILRAFDTMLNMRRSPAEFLQRFSSETGTDYPGKY